MDWKSQVGNDSTAQIRLKNLLHCSNKALKAELREAQDDADWNEEACAETDEALKITEQAMDWADQGLEELEDSYEILKAVCTASFSLYVSRRHSPFHPNLTFLSLLYTKVGNYTQC